MSLASVPASVIPLKVTSQEVPQGGLLPFALRSDIIGDVHGHAERLEALLRKLGYAERRGAWRHPERTAIFVGDFIDRGPQQLRTLENVRDMNVRYSERRG